jgi:hypothetical protein
MGQIQSYVEKKAWEGSSCVNKNCPPLNQVDGIAWDLVLPENRPVKPVPDDDRPVVLYSYGSAQRICLQARDRCAALANLFDMPFAVWDVPGYGHSVGEHTEESVCLASEKIYDELVKQGFTRVFVWGWSLGSVPTCHLAANRPVAGIVLESPIADAIFFNKNAAYAHDILTLLPYIPLNNVSRLTSIPDPKPPILITSVLNDTKVDNAHADCLCAALPGRVEHYRYLVFKDSQMYVSANSPIDEGTKSRVVGEHRYLPRTKNELAVYEGFFNKKEQTQEPEPPSPSFCVSM